MGAVALQAPLLADKATLAGDATEDLLAIDTRQHHGDEASSALLADKNGTFGCRFFMFVIAAFRTGKETTAWER